MYWKVDHIRRGDRIMDTEYSQGQDAWDITKSYQSLVADPDVIEARMWLVDANFSATLATEWRESNPRDDYYASICGRPAAA